jgi:hypothetical protein
MGVNFSEFLKIFIHCIGATPSRGASHYQYIKPELVTVFGNNHHKKHHRSVYLEYSSKMKKTGDVTFLILSIILDLY